MKKFAYASAALAAMLATTISAVAESTNQVYVATASSIVGAATDLGNDVVTRFGPIIVVALVVAAIFAVYNLVRRALSKTGGR